MDFDTHTPMLCPLHLSRAFDKLRVDLSGAKKSVDMLSPGQQVCRSCDKKFVDIGRKLFAIGVRCDNKFVDHHSCGR